MCSSQRAEHAPILYPICPKLAFACMNFLVDWFLATCRASSETRPCGDMNAPILRGCRRSIFSLRQILQESCESLLQSAPPSLRKKQKAFRHPQDMGRPWVWRSPWVRREVATETSTPSGCLSSMKSTTSHPCGCTEHLNHLTRKGEQELKSKAMTS